jgi:uncharacterized protein YjbI with pentapeptide repeats
MLELILDKTFEGEDFTTFTKGEYDNCRFVNCNFLNSDMSKSTFVNCEFTGSNLSSVKVAKTTFNEVIFQDCKMLGIHFEQVEPLLLAFSFDTCQLDFASFYQLKLPKTHFKNCSLQEVDFVETDLRQAIFEHCNLARAIFDFSDLQKADFSTASNFSINPNKNKLKGAKFDKAHLAGLLASFRLNIK